MAQDYGKLISLSRLELYDDLIKQELANHIATHATNAAYGHVIVDTVLTENSTNPVTAAVIYRAIADVIASIGDDSERVVLAAHQLADPRSFSITGGGVAPPVSFDGLANVALNLQAVNCDVLMQDGGEWLVLDGSLTGYIQETNS